MHFSKSTKHSTVFVIVIFDLLIYTYANLLIMVCVIVPFETQSKSMILFDKCLNKNEGIKFSAILE
jgi:hypothetical protein